jgi:hypothetical protein
VIKKARNRGKPPPKQSPGSRAKCSTERLHSPCYPVSCDWAAARCVSQEELLPACHPTPPLRSCARTNQTKEEETRRNQDTGKAAKSWRAASLPFPSLPTREIGIAGGDQLATCCTAAVICGSINSTHLPKSVQQLAVAEIGEGEEEERNPWRLCSPRWRAAFCSAHRCHPGAAGGVNFAFWSLVWSASSLCIHLICFDLIDVFLELI